MGEDFENDLDDDEGLDDNEGFDNSEEMLDDLDDDIPKIKLHENKKLVSSSLGGWFKGLVGWNGKALETCLKNFLISVDSFLRDLYESQGSLRKDMFKKWRDKINPPIRAINKQLKELLYPAKVELTTPKFQTAGERAAAIIYDLNAVFALLDPDTTWGKYSNLMVTKWLDTNEKLCEYENLKHQIEKLGIKTKKNDTELRRRKHYQMEPPINELHHELESLRNETKKKFEEIDDAKKNANVNKIKEKSEISITKKAFQQNNVTALKKLKPLIKKLMGEEKITGVSKYKWKNFIKSHLDTYIKKNDDLKECLKKLGI